MSEPITVGQLLLRQLLPGDVYSGETLDKDGLRDLMGRVARQYPERYEDISHQMVKLGLSVGESTGGATFSIKDMRTPKAALLRERLIRTRMRSILDSSQGEDRRQQIRDLLEIEAPKQTQEILDESNAEDNAFARQLKGAGRGSAGALASMRGGNVAVGDASGRTVPIPITRGYASGLTPMQYLAAAYGARKGLATTKLGVGQGGFLCFTGETLVRMADGSTRRIDQIVPGDWVLGADKTGRTMPVKVLNRWDNGYQGVVSYDFSINSQHTVGFSVVATPGHEVLAVVDAYYKSRFCISHPQSQAVKGSLLKVQLGNCKSRKHRLYLNGQSAAWSGRQYEPFAWLISQLLARVAKWDLARQLLGQLAYPRKFPVTARVRTATPLGDCPVFDLEVKHPDHMYVLACGLVVSNSKLLQQAGHRLVVTSDDDETPVGRMRGLLVDTDDHSNIGALLATDYLSLIHI